jgi:hypothetical protein
MYTSETLMRDRHNERLERARESGLARQAAELRRLQRARQRAERRLLRAWRRADELRSVLEGAG